MREIGLINKVPYPTTAGGQHTEHSQMVTSKEGDIPREFMTNFAHFYPP